LEKIAEAIFSDISFVSGGKSVVLPPAVARGYALAGF
jgi:hypothetical protein